MPSTRLSAADWVDAALQVLSSDGPDAVAIQPLARTLGATKGSFYWHFGTRDELLRAVLERWVVVATDDVIAEVDAEPGDAAAKARRLIRLLSETYAAGPGQLGLLAAVGHADVAAAVETATTRRLAYLAKLLRAAGHPRAAATRRANIAYAACVGYAQLERATPSALPATARGRRELLDELAELVLTDPV